MDQTGLVGPINDDEYARGDRQEDDAVGERQSVATGVQLPRQVSGLSQDGAEHRKAVERGVDRQPQDQRGRRYDQVEAWRKVVEHGVGEVGGYRVLLVA